MDNNVVVIVSAFLFDSILFNVIGYGFIDFMKWSDYKLSLSETVIHPYIQLYINLEQIVIKIVLNK